MRCKKEKQEKYIVHQAITDDDISVVSLQQVKKTGESLPTYSVNAASVHFGFDLHLDGNSHDNPDPPTQTLTQSDLEPHPHHSNTTLPIPPTPTTSELEPNLPHSEISFDNFDVPNDFNDYEDSADYDADDYSSDDDDFSDDDGYDDYDGES